MENIINKSPRGNKKKLIIIILIISFLFSIASVSALTWNDPNYFLKLAGGILTGNVTLTGTNVGIITNYIWNATGFQERLRPEDIIDVDKEDIETDLNTFVDVAGDNMSGDLHIQGASLNTTNITAINISAKFVNATDNITTSEWFNGLFNWSASIASDLWLSFTGAELSFNESEINRSVTNIINESNTSMKSYVDAQDIDFNATVNAYITFINSSVWNYSLDNNNTMKAYVDINNNSMVGYIGSANTTIWNRITDGNTTIWANFGINFDNITTYLATIQDNATDIILNITAANTTLWNRIDANNASVNYIFSVVHTNLTSLKATVQNNLTTANSTTWTWISNNNDSMKAYVDAQAAGEPLWTANYTAFNDSWSTTYNQTYVDNNNSMKGYLDAQDIIFNATVNASIILANTTTWNRIDADNNSMKGYVDDNYVNLAGDIMTGNLTTVNITANRLNLSENLYLNKTITFIFDETIDNLIDGILWVTGELGITERVWAKDGINTTSANFTENINVTGNASIGGPLQVTGNLTVDAGVFKVDSISDTVEITGNLETSKQIWSRGGFNGTEMNLSTNLNVTGNASIGMLQLTEWSNFTKSINITDDIIVRNNITVGGLRIGKDTSGNSIIQGGF
jgi:hypothetical protein